MHVWGAATQVRGSERWRGVKPDIRLERELLESLHQSPTTSLMVVVWMVCQDLPLFSEATLGHKTEFMRRIQIPRPEEILLIVLEPGSQGKIPGSWKSVPIKCNMASPSIPPSQNTHSQFPTLSNSATPLQHSPCPLNQPLQWIISCFESKYYPGPQSRHNGSEESQL